MYGPWRKGMMKGKTRLKLNYTGELYFAVLFILCSYKNIEILLNATSKFYNIICRTRYINFLTYKPGLITYICWICISISLLLLFIWWATFILFRFGKQQNSDLKYFMTNILIFWLAYINSVGMTTDIMT